MLHDRPHRWTKGRERGGRRCLCADTRPGVRRQGSRLTLMVDSLTDHYAEAVQSKPGQCWRRIRVWNCEGHREGVEKPKPWTHLVDE